MAFRGETSLESNREILRGKVGAAKQTWQRMEIGNFLLFIQCNTLHVYKQLLDTTRDARA